MQNIGIIAPFCLPGGTLSFSVPSGGGGGEGGQKKLLGSGLLWGNSTQADTVGFEFGRQKLVTNFRDTKIVGTA